MDGIIIVATFVLSIAQFMVCIFVEPKIPIKLKETDTLQRIRKRKRNYEISILILGILMFIFFYYGLKNQILIFGMISAFLIIFFLTGARTILDRIEKKERLLKGNNSFTVAMEKVKNMTLKDSITIADEELREAIISDDIEEIQGFKALFKTGEEYTTQWDTKILFYIMSKSHQDKIIKANIKGVSLEELEGDKVKLIITTQSSNTFSTTIEKVDLPKWIK